MYATPVSIKFNISLYFFHFQITKQAMVDSEAPLNPLLIQVPFLFLHMLTMTLSLMFFILKHYTIAYLKCLNLQTIYGTLIKHVRLNIHIYFNPILTPN